MKKLGVLIVFAFLCLFNLFALESEPSETVGYVKYDCQSNANGDYNFIALSLDAGYTNASDLGAAYSSISSIKQWDPTAQEWVASDDWGGGFWSPDNVLNPNEAIFVTIDTPLETIYIAGELNDPAQYSLVTNANGDYNAIMLPFEQSSLTTSQQMGEDISSCLSVRSFDNVSQTWLSSDNFGGGFWTNVFSVETGFPYIANVSANSTWPASRADLNLQLSKEQQK